VLREKNHRLTELIYQFQKAESEKGQDLSIALLPKPPLPKKEEEPELKKPKINEKLEKIREWALAQIKLEKKDEED